jgi:hypothetical protein
MKFFLTPLLVIKWVLGPILWMFTFFASIFYINPYFDQIGGFGVCYL